MNFSAQSVGGSGRRRQTMWRAGRATGLTILIAALAGCQTQLSRVGLLAPEPDYHPANVFAYPPNLSPNLQRVAVLPLAATANLGDLPEGCDALSPVLWEQLVKSKKFEVVTVPGDKLRSRTGRPTWTGTESLPVDFLPFLRREYGCDAVLFSELTAYHAYAPMVIGWRLKLVDARTGQILWAVDDLFDAGRPAIANAACHFEKRLNATVSAEENSWVVLNSPRRFGRYSAAALLDTLPDR
jgi:hypothetical protein